jgi:hypothetical protein
MEYDDDDEDGGELLSAVVLGHSQNRADVLDETRPLRARGTDCAHLYTGRVRARLSSLVGP